MSIAGTSALESDPAHLILAMDKILKLHGETSIFCADEESMSNFKFGEEVEKDTNQNI